MKKLLALLLAFAMVFALASCNSTTSPTPTPTQAPTEAPEVPEVTEVTEVPEVPEVPDDTKEIALITDLGSIDDGSFNQGAWEGMKAYADANGKTYAYYRPFEDSDAGRLENIAGAVKNGAKVVICPGYLFSEAIFVAQSLYPDVQFLLLDTEPADPADPYSGLNVATPNTHSIYYREEQSGFLAGYGAVIDGFRNLGYLGGMEMPPVTRFGYGYIQGAEYAAKELGLAAGDVKINYWYSGGFEPTDDIYTKMNAWYATGTEIVFACGGGIYLSCLNAADTNNGLVIGVDKDQGPENPRFLTSATKGLSASVEIALTALYENGGTWDETRAGVAATLGIDQDCVGLPTVESSWRFRTWTLEEYEALVDLMKTGELVVSDDFINAPAVELVAVDYQN